MGEVGSGAVELQNLSEHSVSSAEELVALIGLAKAKRSVAATEMNDASSRSHGVAIFTVPQPGLLQDGKLFVIDLAGSESAKDMQKHDKQRMEETKQINISLNALKECIQARTLASSPGAAASTHVPYRRSKLTLLLKDIFDISCPRLTATCVLATVNPMARDAGQSSTTLGYASPLREAVGMFGRKKKKPTKKSAAPEAEAAEPELVLEVNPMDPALWSPVQLAAWLSKQGVQDMTSLEGFTGLQLCALPEPELFAAVGDPDVGSRVVTSLWELIVAAKMVKRRPDGTILSDEAEAAEKAAEEAATIDRIEAQRAKAEAAIQADLATRGITDES